jgi:hypothetical protein
MAKSPFSTYSEPYPVEPEPRQELVVTCSSKEEEIPLPITPFTIEQVSTLYDYCIL